MLRKPESKYEGKRSATLLKVKKFFDVDVKVIGHQKGTGKYKDVMGALNVEDKQGVKFKVGTGFTDKERDDPPKIGAIIEVKYQERTNDGSYRFPSFKRVRTDLKKL